MKKSKINIYVDMDGVIADFNGQTDAVARFEKEKDFFTNLQPLEQNLQAVKDMLADGNFNVFILSASPNNRADGDKRKWLKNYLPTLKRGHAIIMRNGEKKIDYMKTPDGILFDDYGKNRREWTDGNPNNQAVKVQADGDIFKALTTLMN